MIKLTNDKHPWCDGGALGHPKVYLEFNENQEVLCGYCGIKYIYREDGGTKSTKTTE